MSKTRTLGQKIGKALLIILMVFVLLCAATGAAIAKIAAEKGITEVVFDRGGYIYHGRVKELAEGAREGGLKFC